MDKRISTFLQSLGKDDHSHIRIYVLVTIIFLILAVFSLLLIPHGTRFQQCEGIILGGSKDSCLYSLALSTKNDTICSYMTEPGSNNCYASVAENTSDPTICGKVYDNVITQTECIDVIANETDNYKTCYYLNGSYRDNCLVGSALESSNASICNGINDPVNKTACNSGVAMQLAVKNGNPNYCGIVTNSTDFNTTVYSILDSNVDSYPKVSTNATPILEYATFVAGASFNAKDFCYFAVAAQTGNTFSCGSIGNGNIQQDCYTLGMQYTATANALAGNSINYTSLLLACYNQSSESSCNATISILKASSTENQTICASLNQSEANYCYIYVAQSSHNADVCSHIQNLTLNNACVQDTTYNSTAAPPAYASGA